MAIDFLRNLAFDGFMQGFLQDDLFEFGEKSTGVSIRFSDDYIRRHYRKTERDLRRNEYEGYRSDGIDEELSSLTDELRFNNRDSVGFLKDKSSIEIVVDYEKRESDWISDAPDNWEGISIRYREMGPIISSYSPGDPICGGIKNGTLCGFLSDPSGNNMYALTCGHVAENIGTQVSHKSQNTLNLGQTAYSVLPANAGNCSFRAQPNSDGVDAALIEVNPSVSLQHGTSRVVEPISRIDQGDLLQFHGQGSRRNRPAKVWAATIWKKIDLRNDGKLLCCGDLCELTHQSVQYVLSSLAQPGDSGSAVVRSTNPNEWVGMIIGRAGGSAFACYAEHVLDWADSKVPGIRPYP